MAPIYTNFEEGGGVYCARRKNAIFLVKIFQKVPENAFVGLFFQNFACGAENVTKKVFLEFYFVDLKKVEKIFKNRPSPLEKILDPPLNAQKSLRRYLRFKKLITKRMSK